MSEITSLCGKLPTKVVTPLLTKLKSRIRSVYWLVYLYYTTYHFDCKGVKFSRKMNRVSARRGADIARMGRRSRCCSAVAAFSMIVSSGKPTAPYRKG